MLIEVNIQILIPPMKIKNLILKKENGMEKRLKLTQGILPAETWDNILGSAARILALEHFAVVNGRLTWDPQSWWVLKVLLPSSDFWGEEQSFFERAQKVMVRYIFFSLCHPCALYLPLSCFKKTHQSVQKVVRWHPEESCNKQHLSAG